MPLALVLAMALLLLVGWGQVHRVLHPAGTAVSAPLSAPGAGHAHHHDAERHLGHAAGGALCLLADHLADGVAAMQPPGLPMASRPSACLPQPGQSPVAAAQARPFDARGPPSLA